MNIIERGEGTPVVVVPGIQGRWEWMKPTIEALASRCHVITFSLADEPTCDGRFDETDGFPCYVEQVREALDTVGLQSASICGVSYGGLIAAAFAARYPERVSSLVLVSALSPSWTPDRRVRFYLRAPRLLSPLFAVASLRLIPEIMAATPGFVHGTAAALRHGWRVLTHMMSPGRMARRVQLLQTVDLQAQLGILHVPTLVITGEGSLDRVVPVRITHEYLRLWPHARTATLERTGHLGSITRPQEFAGLVVPFADGTDRERAGRRRVG
jgi:pimeloyl-ACP methyl ester carboxylesterase